MGVNLNGRLYEEIEDELLKKVFIQFNDPTIGNSFKESNSYIDIFLQLVYQGNKGYGNVERIMLPIIFCWTVTVHKQGITVEKAVVYLGKKVFAESICCSSICCAKTCKIFTRISNF